MGDGTGCSLSELSYGSGQVDSETSAYSKIKIMKTNTLVLIMAHGEKYAEEALYRHFDEWTKYGHDMILFTPGNKHLNCDGPQLSYGLASHHDKKAIDRFKFLLRFLSKMEFGQFAIFEYDSFILNDRLPDVGTSGLMGVKFSEPDVETWGSGMFIHPPFIVGRSALKALVKEANELHFDIENKAQGFWDRYLGILVERAGRDIAFQPLKWGVDSWSNNTIEDEHIPEVALAVKNGANWIHGCKSAKAYEAIKQAFEGRQK